MKFDLKYPDMQEIHDERNGIIKGRIPVKCHMCEDKTQYVDINYECHLCSEECVAKLDQLVEESV